MQGGVFQMLWWSKKS